MQQNRTGERGRRDNLSLSNGKYSASQTIIHDKTLTQAENSSYMEKLFYRTVSFSYQLPFAQEEADIADVLQASGFEVNLIGPDHRCNIDGLRVIKQSTWETILSVAAEELLATANPGSKPVAILRVPKSWSAIDKIIGIQDDCGPHRGTVLHAMSPLMDKDGTPCYSERGYAYHHRARLL